MTMMNSFDIASLIKEAEHSEQRESYRVLEKTQKYRVGVGVRISATSPSFFLEVVIHSPTTFITYIPFMKALQERGYVVSCHEETCTVLELILSRGSLDSEITYLSRVLQTAFEDKET
jgi:hypothetical protein